MILKLSRSFSLLLLVSALCGVGHAQVLKWKGADLGVAATGQFTTSITDQTYAQTGGFLLPHNGTTNSPGALVTLQDYQVRWIGFEVNYQYTHLAERYNAGANDGNYVQVPTGMHEFTAAYLLRKKTHGVTGHLAVGGGSIDFDSGPATQTNPGFLHTPNQWRATGLFDVGIDMQTKSNLGFRIGARDLLYRAPNYHLAYLSSSRWVSTEEPYAGVYVRF
jgi:hypothetical protein